MSCQWLAAMAVWAARALAIGGVTALRSGLPVCGTEALSVADDPASLGPSVGGRRFCGVAAQLTNMLTMLTAVTRVTAVPMYPRIRRTAARRPPRSPVRRTVRTGGVAHDDGSNHDREESTEGGDSADQRSQSEPVQSHPARDHCSGSVAAMATCQLHLVMMPHVQVRPILPRRLLVGRQGPRGRAADVEAASALTVGGDWYRGDPQGSVAGTLPEVKFRYCWTPATVRSKPPQRVLNWAVASVLPLALFLNVRFTTAPRWATQASSWPGEARLIPSMRRATCRTPSQVGDSGRHWLDGLESGRLASGRIGHRDHEYAGRVRHPLGWRGA